ncbi:SAM-dependent methyltransferase [Mariprofundus erugo]|uniref:class I SAM-dependent methyltransferase n=1 Tax=Mariprofundus erugo TaxID=2528639 RepID=UPI0010FCFFA2|nr:SAM-dependent methyltransferase [Mariprofundus erugo]TLS73611.1 SAM-dependent methyltransferase [Mariprofundus erugo]
MTEQSRLEQIIRTRISDAGGFLPMDEYMQAALYEPALGYYESKTVFGKAGDFITAPELGPWLGLGFADLIANVWQQMGEPEHWTLMEQGSGSGKLLVLVSELLGRMLPAPPSRLISVERSEGLRQRQKALFDERGMHVEQYASLDEIEPVEHIVVLSNELPDAFPVRCFCYRSGQFFERGISVGDDGALAWRSADQPMQAPPAIAAELIASWPDGYISEFNPGLSGWQQSVARIVQRGVVMTLDYGYSQAEYYRPGRVEGTLLAHAGHTAVADVFTGPGSRDITAHVDFTELVRCGRSAGLQPVMWMTQGGWLAQSPSLQSFVESLARQPDANSMHLLAHAKRLLMPFGMGEVFKLLIQSANVAIERPAYLAQFDHLKELLSPCR